MRESKIEAHLVKEVARIGGKAVKMVPTYHSGLPDRLVLYRGRTVFVELKKPGGKPRKLQVHFLDQLKAEGFDTRVLDTIEGVDAFVKELKTGGDAG